MTGRFTTTRRVEFCDTDVGGMAHFSNFYRYMEQTEHEFFRSLGLSIHRRENDASLITWPRVAASCSFEAPAYFEDVLEIRLTVARRGAKSLTTAFEFLRGETLIARGQMTSVCCRLVPGQPMRAIEIPPPYSELIGPDGDEPI